MIIVYKLIFCTATRTPDSY